MMSIVRSYKPSIIHVWDLRDDSSILQDSCQSVPTASVDVRLHKLLHIQMFKEESIVEYKYRLQSLVNQLFLVSHAHS